ncbi:MAG: acylphosphatase [Gaiellaceae bacterium]
MRVHVVVHGRVQGVGFRQSAASRARSLGIAGWVSNRGDGAVEAVFEGPADRVESMVAWCRRGPAAAAVERVDETREPPRGEQGFHVEFAQRPLG